MQLEDAAALAEQLATAVDTLPFAPRSEDEEITREALSAAAARLAYVVRRTPRAFVPEEWLIMVQGAFDPVIASVREHAGTEDDTPLPISSSEITRLWGAISAFLPAIVPEDSVSEDAATFRRSVGQLVRRLTDEVRDAEARLARHEESLNAAAQDRNAEFETLRQSQAALDEAIRVQHAGVETVLAEHQRAFEDELHRFARLHEERIDENGRALGGALEAGQRQIQAVSERAEKAAEASTARIAELEQKALKSYSTIGDASVAGYYQKHANDEKHQANLWRWIAVAVFTLAAVGVLVELTLRDGTIAWPETRSRLLLVIPLAALATFATAEARSHRRAERESRRREVELSSLDPYLVLIEDRDRAEAIKLRYAQRLFVENGAYASTEPTAPEASIRDSE